MKLLKDRVIILYVILITLFSHVNDLGYLRVGVVPVTILPIIVVPALAYKNNWRCTIFISFVWGLNAWIKPLYSAEDQVGIWFSNPLIGFIPRFLSGLVTYSIMKVIIEKSRKLDFTKSLKWANVVSIIMISMLIYISTVLSAGLNGNYGVLYAMAFGLGGVLITMYMRAVISGNLLSGWLFLIGLFSGIVISIVHSTLTLLALVVFAKGDNEQLYNVVNYSINTVFPIELALTAFISLILVPIVVRLWPSRSGI